MLIKKVIIIDLVKKQQVFKIYLYESIYKKQVVFKDLQTTFVFFIFLIYYDKKRQFYINLNVFKQ